MPKILCIYGTTSGNTELVAEKVIEVLCAAGHEARAQRVERTKIEEMEDYDLCILAASTYGHGILQDYFIPFAEQLKTVDLSGRRFAIIGLGDNKYDAEYHIESARILEKIVKAQNGEQVCTPLKVSKSPLPQLETKVKEWAEALAQIMN